MTRDIRDTCLGLSSKATQASIPWSQRRVSIVLSERSFRPVVLISHPHTASTPLSSISSHKKPFSYAPVRRRPPSSSARPD